MLVKTTEHQETSVFVLSVDFYGRFTLNRIEPLMHDWILRVYTKAGWNWKIKKTAKSLSWMLIPGSRGSHHPSLNKLMVLKVVDYPLGTPFMKIWFTGKIQHGYNCSLFWVQRLRVNRGSSHKDMPGVPADLRTSAPPFTRLIDQLRE